MSAKDFAAVCLNEQDRDLKFKPLIQKHPNILVVLGMGGLSFKEAKQRLVENFERRFIEAALERNAGNISRTADEIGMYRQHLQGKLAEYGIEAASYRPAK